ncbi:MAG: hypothetical protein E6767_20625, partial [Dysgonomonas sp.]|nr:hypothetical protein [Dysgonomonas sp.]
AVGQLMAPTSATDALVKAGDFVTLGAVSANVDFVNAVSADIYGGDGSNTGKVVGGRAFDAAMIATAVKAGRTVSSAIKESNSIKPKAFQPSFVVTPKGEAIAYQKVQQGL